jgi:hypothetical protein
MLLTKLSSCGKTLLVLSIHTPKRKCRKRIKGSMRTTLSLRA